MRARNEQHQRLGLETLEDRLTPSWMSTPPNTIPVPSSFADVTLNRHGDAAGHADITGAGEVDWYQFTSFNGLYTFAAGTPRSRLDPVIGVYDASGQLLASNDDKNGRSLDSCVAVTLTAGTYYLGVTTFADPNFPATTGRYNWSIRGPASDTPATPFQITLRLTGLSAFQAAVFQRAANRWAEVITGDLPSTTYGGDTLSDPSFTARPVDDVLIEASATRIDGRGGILGQAGPDGFRFSGSGLPYHGVMQFDSADLAWLQRSGGLYYTVLHEMGHVLGIGTLWGGGLLTGAGTSDPRFIGTNAVAAYNEVFHTSVTGVPVENRGGGGTRDSHWRESVFRNELMTGYLNPGRNPLSLVTVASLADLGYQVNMDAADRYTPRRLMAAVSGPAAGSGASLLAPAQPAAGLFAPPDDSASEWFGVVALPPDLWAAGGAGRARDPLAYLSPGQS